MYVKVPEAVWTGGNASPSGLIYLEPHSGGGWNYIQPWLCRDEDIVTEKKQDLSLFFREKRRKDFSDVCHAKLLAPSDPFEINCDGELYQCSRNERFFISGRVERAKTLSLGSWDLGGDAIVISNGKLCLMCTMYCTRESTYQYRVNINAVAYRKKLPTSGAWNGAAYYAQSSAKIKYSSTNRKWTRFSCSTDDFSLAQYYQDILKTVNPQDEGPEQYGLAVEMMHIPERVVDQLYAWVYTHPDFTNRSTSLAYSTTTLMSRPDPQFLLHEPGVIMDHLDDVLYGRGFESYFRNVLIQNAFLDMVKNVPRMNENNISNILEISSFIKSLVLDHRVEVPKRLSDAWLAYRYSYSTTKSDIEDAIDFVHRNVALGNWTSIKCYGQHYIIYNGVRITCRCCASVKPRITTTVGKIWRDLYSYGLTPTFYAAWDMIPYSFIVDWFIPISDVMAAWDARKVVDEYYDFQSITLSLSYTRYDQGRPVHYYTRWLSATPIALRGYYFFEGTKTSDETVLKRILDAASLIMG